jgi:acyl-CoA thioesterase-1
MTRFLAVSLLVSCTACTDPHPTSTPAPASAPAAVPAAAPARYLALGDSFTIGTGSTPEDSFPARLVARTACGAALRNVAVNGYSTADILERELPEVAAFSPTFVTLAAGANDIVRGSTVAEYRGRVRTLVGALRSAGVRFVTLPQPDWSLSPAAAAFGEPADIRARIVEANAILREETAAAGGTYVDLFPMMQEQATRGWIARDGLHPSPAAYDAWAEELARRGVSPCG